LQERVVERLAAREPIVDVRLITATNRDLAADVRAGGFRADLFYRLNVFPIAIPPLRERRADIAELATHFLAHFAKQHRKPRRLFHLKRSRTRAHDWPGNVRELQNVIGACADRQRRRGTGS